MAAFNLNFNFNFNFNFKVVGVGPHRPETRQRAGLWTPRFFTARYRWNDGHVQTQL